MKSAPKFGPFQNDRPKTNVGAYRNPGPSEPPVDHARRRKEISEYFTKRHERLRIQKTTRTANGQILDWIPIESQHPKSMIASPPRQSKLPDGRIASQPEGRVIAELEQDGSESGPHGTVPILRKNLDAIGYTKSLRQYLSKYFGQPVMNFRGIGALVPGDGRGTHHDARTGQKIICFGGEGQFSCFHPYVDKSDEFSLIQIFLSNSDLPALQTVEAGWQVYPDWLGDWVPHLFTYYTTNGYAWDDDGLGGYNQDVDGWVQYDNVIFPGSTFGPLSKIGGDQRQITIKYQHYRDNWWLSCQGRWVGYYPGRLFMGNQSVFSTLGDHADRIAFWGEVATPGSAPTKTDMGSGRFANEGWTRAAYMHNLRVQINRIGGMANYDGSSRLGATNDKLYSVDAHFNSGTNWGSYIYVGGPGAG